MPSAPAAGSTPVFLSNRRRVGCSSIVGRRRTLFTYSGDTEWFEGLLSVANGADIFIVECFGYSGHIPAHLTWEILKPRLSDLRARRIMLTHMGPSMFAHLDEVRGTGVLIAEDGAVIELQH